MTQGTDMGLHKYYNCTQLSGFNIKICQFYGLKYNNKKTTRYSIFCTKKIDYFQKIKSCLKK